MQSRKNASPVDAALQQGADRLVTPAEAAELLGVTEQTLAHWRVRRRHLPFVKVGVGKQARVRYLASDLVAWAARRRVEVADAERR